MTFSFAFLMYVCVGAMFLYAQGDPSKAAPIVAAMKEQARDAFGEKAERMVVPAFALFVFGIILVWLPLYVVYKLSGVDLKQPDNVLAVQKALVAAGTQKVVTEKASVHVCFSGDLACSGVRPCRHCYAVHYMNVLRPMLGWFAAGEGELSEDAILEEWGKLLGIASCWTLDGSLGPFEVHNVGGLKDALKKAGRLVDPKDLSPMSGSAPLPNESKKEVSSHAE